MAGAERVAGLHRFRACRAKAASEAQDATSYAVPRLDAATISRAELEKLVASGPVLLFNVLPNLDAEQWCSDLDLALGNEEVAHQQQIAGPWDLMMWETTFNEFMTRYLPGSHHHDPRFLFDEDFLAREAADEVRLVERLSLPEELFGENLFRYFPEHLRPAPACIVGAGEGARSTFHRDPFEWTGTSFCVIGSKLWTFLPPGDAGVGVTDAAFQAERFAYENYASDDVCIAAGWQAEVDLYSQQSEMCLTAADLATFSPAEKQALLEAMARAQRQWWSSDRSGDPPPLRPEDWVCAHLPRGVTPTCVVHRAGDLLLIPAHWWHQTYALEPSIAVSGQYMNEANSETVMSHIAKWRGVDMPSLRGLTGVPPKEQVEHFLSSTLPDELLRGDAFLDGPGESELFIDGDDNNDGDDDDMFALQF